MIPKLELMALYLQGALPSDKIDELSDLIRHDRAFRREAALLLYQEVHLRELAQEAKARGEDWLAEPLTRPLVERWSQKLLARPRLAWAAAAAGVCLLITLLSLRPHPGTGPAPRLAAVDGQVRLERAGQQHTLTAPAPLQSGDRLRLESGASATIQYGREETWFRLFEAAEAQLGSGTAGKAITLTRGALSARVAPQPVAAPLTITTPRAVATVLGTDLSLHTDDTATRLEVWKGQVNLRRTADDASVLVKGDEFAVAQEGGPLVTGNLEHGVRRVFWRGAAANSLADLARRSPVLGSPGGSEQLLDFKAPSNWGDGFTARFQAYVRPPRTGEYRFWIAGDDEAELWLSPDENPDRKVKICATGGWTQDAQWDKNPAQRSATMRLEAGRMYYLEALQLENAGGDCLAVAWQIPGQERELLRRQYLTPPPVRDSESKRPE